MVQSPRDSFDSSWTLDGRASDRKGRAAAQVEPCWRSGACIPKKGANVSRCDLAEYNPATPPDCTGNIGGNFVCASFEGTACASSENYPVGSAGNTNGLIMACYTPCDS